MGKASNSAVVETITGLRCRKKSPSFRLDLLHLLAEAKAGTVSTGNASMGFSVVKIRGWSSCEIVDNGRLS